MKKEYKNLIIITIFYLIYVILFIGKFNFNPSATIELSQNHLHQFTGTFPDNLIIHNSDGFDGQYYYMMSLDFSFNNLKIGANFIQRIIYPFLAFLLSLGVKKLLPISFLLINFACILLSSCILMKLLKKYNASLNLVFLWALNVGFLISITRNLTEPLMILFIITSIYFYEYKKHYLASLFLALSILTRELALTFYVGFLLFFLIKKDFKKFLIYFLAIVPFAIWQIILFYKIGFFPILLSFQALGIPIGILNYLQYIPQQVTSNPAITLNLTSNNFFNILKNLNSILSPIPVVLFFIVQLFILIKIFIKHKKITLYTILLLSQLALLALLHKSLFWLEIDAIGRYALGMYLFSILYFVEKKKKYNILLLLSILLSSVLYFIQRAIIPKGGFYIT